MLCFCCTTNSLDLKGSGLFSDWSLSEFFHVDKSLYLLGLYFPFFFLQNRDNTYSLHLRLLMISSQSALRTIKYNLDVKCYFYALM